jgi:hypothetical protein
MGDDAASDIEKASFFTMFFLDCAKFFLDPEPEPQPEPEPKLFPKSELEPL